MSDVKILGIETSCDETSASVVMNGREVLSNCVSTQIEIHEKYGGVVPEIASRKHVEFILPIISQALKDADISLNEIDGLAVTYGPGLVGALLVGISAAKAISLAYKKPLIPINHIEGHICANYIEHKNLTPPFLCLVASGGHSHIVKVNDYDSYEIIGQTRDDAAGEAYDKIARVLQLGYPGGPKIEKAALTGNPEYIKFPQAKFSDSIYDFSFSGLKTNVINHINKIKQKNESLPINDIAASFQKAVAEVLIDNLICASINFNINKVALAGGVAANKFLRDLLSTNSRNKDLKVFYPKVELCTDNAAMIGSAGYFAYENKAFSNLDLNAVPNLKIGKKYP